MAKPKIELKFSDYSILNKFVAWYAEEYSTTSNTGRKMKGKTTTFLIEFLEKCCNGSSTESTFSQYFSKFKKFSETKDKSKEEIDAERALKDKPEELKEWKRLHAKIAKSKLPPKS